MLTLEEFLLSFNTASSVINNIPILFSTFREKNEDNLILNFLRETIDSDYPFDSLRPLKGLFVLISLQIHLVCIHALFHTSSWHQIKQKQNLLELP